MDTGDVQLRHHLEVLADAGVIHAPVTTWPMTWAAVLGDVFAANYADVPDHVARSLDYVRSAASDAQNTRTALQFHSAAAGNVAGFTDFGLEHREEREIGGSIEHVGERYAFNLSATYAPDASDSEDKRLDGSYLVGTLGNWTLGFAQLDRWWGPGWNASTILSNNARPVPSLMLQRGSSEAFETRWLSWIGPWSFVAFVGQMEGDREDYSNPYLIGGRVSFRPWSPLEIGLTRTAQWGGDGRPESLDSFIDMVVGTDNQTSGSVDDGTIDVSDQPGNQLAGVDVRYSFGLGDTYNALYAQFTGEDEAGGLPAKKAWQAGAETSFAAGSWSHRFAFEYDNTFTDFNDTETLYENVIYQEGYRRYGRTIGASFDNDTRFYGLNGFHVAPNDSLIRWTIAHVELNVNGNELKPPGGSPYPDRTITMYYKASYTVPWTQSLKFTIGAEHYGKTVNYSGEELDTTVFGRLDYRF
jgi:hypothetical protein